MMSITSSSVSCGVRQIYDLDAYPHESRLHALLGLMCGMYVGPMAMVVFSDADGNGNGHQLAAEIRKEFGKIGLVKATSVNPNTGNQITTWIWAPNWLNVADYMTQATRPGAKGQAVRAFTKAQVTEVRSNYRDGPSDNDDDEYRDNYDEDDTW